MKLRKYFLFAVVMLFGIFALASCGGGGGDDEVDCTKNPNHADCKDPDGEVDCTKNPDHEDCKDPVEDVNCALDRDNELCDDPETWNWEYNKDDWDGKGMTIKIMVNPISEHDPNDVNYSGERKNEKRNLIAKLEAEYNIDLEYVNYPGEAPWGPERVKWISTGVASGTDVGEIFQIDSSWIPTLARNSAVAELYNTTRETGIFTEYNYVQSENYNLMTSSGSKVYGYGNGEARPDHWLHYNQSLIDQYGLPDPATLWNDGEWTWSAFKALLAQAQAAFDAGEDKKYAMGGDKWDAAVGFVAAKGSNFVKNGRVFLNSQPVIDVFTELQVIQDLYWEPNGGTMSSTEFREGQVLFATGSMWWYQDNSRWPADLPFSISAVPYPRNDDDPNLENYNVPIGYESVFAIRNVTNGQNGLTASILFNIFDDLSNGLKPESAATRLEPDEKYRAYLEARIDSEESIEAIMFIQTSEDLTYFEMINVLSMSLGNGSHYGNVDVCIYPRAGNLIANPNNDQTPAVVLGELQPIYQNKLDELLRG